MLVAIYGGVSPVFFQSRKTSACGLPAATSPLPASRSTARTAPPGTRGSPY